MSNTAQTAATEKQDWTFEDETNHISEGMDITYEDLEEEIG
jgi:hypothetical protein